MTERNGAGWFAGLDPATLDTATGAIRDGTAAAPRDWPTAAVDAGIVDDEDEYYDRLRAVTIAAAREAVTEREQADDQQLVHAVRAMTT